MVIFMKQNKNFQTFIMNQKKNGGELTPELEEKLLLTQDNFKTKLNGYVNVINEITSKIDACKTEEKRISTLRKSREKIY